MLRRGIGAGPSAIRDRWETGPSTAAMARMADGWKVPDLTLPASRAGGSRLGGSRPRGSRLGGGRTRAPRLWRRGLSVARTGLVRRRRSRRPPSGRRRAPTGVADARRARARASAMVRAPRCRRRRGAGRPSRTRSRPAMLVCAYEAHHNQPFGRSRCSPRARGAPPPSPSLTGGSGGPGGSSWSIGFWAPGAPVRGARAKRPSLDRARLRRDPRNRVGP